ncbi:3'-5' exonuclease [Bacillus sp. C11]|nr:3'-5' exonuclease [Neobacillus terrae]
MGMHEMIQFFRQMSGKLGSNVYAGINGNTDPKQISFIRQLQKEMKEKNQLGTNLAFLETVVFDLETTGFNPDKGEQVISIGAIKMSGTEIKEEQCFYSLVRTNSLIPAHIAELTNITDEELLIAPSPSEVLLKFYEFIDSHVLIAHHAKHERAFMQKWNRDCLRSSFEHRILDTSFLIRLQQQSYKSEPLENICSNCGIEVMNRHHALQDAKMTARIWQYYLKKALESGFNNLYEVYDYLARL